MDSFVLLVSASFSCCFGFLLLSYGRLFIEFLLSQVTDDTVAGALSLETTQCAFNVFVFTNSNRRHTCFHHPLPMRFLNYLNIIARKKGIVKPFFALFLYFSVEKWELLRSFKITGRMFAPRTDKIVGKFAFVDVTANFAHPLFTLRRSSLHLGFLFDICLIILIRNRFFVV